MNCVDIHRTTGSDKHLFSNASMLIKSRQTGMLVCTGIAGFLYQRTLPFDWLKLAGLAGSLFLAISGATILNMVYDRDIDRKMSRTRQRPLASGQVNARSAFILGGVCIMAGMLWALTLSKIYAIIVFIGICLDLVVYTIWLKRRSAWSILWGGLAGGMPILAGSTLAAGRIELTGMLLALAIVCWIPGHNLSLNMLYADDYGAAGIPTILQAYGAHVSRFLVLSSCILTAIMLLTAALLLRSPWVVSILVAICGFALTGLAVYLQVNPTRQVIHLFYKADSIYMMAVMILVGLIGLV